MATPTVSTGDDDDTGEEYYDKTTVTRRHIVGTFFFIRFGIFCGAHVADDGSRRRVFRPCSSRDT